MFGKLCPIKKMFLIGGGLHPPSQHMVLYGYIPLGFLLTSDGAPNLGPEKVQVGRDQNRTVGLG